MNIQYNFNPLQKEKNLFDIQQKSKVNKIKFAVNIILKKILKSINKKYKYHYQFKKNLII